MKTGDTKVISTNRKAFHDFYIVEKIEAGIVLTGTEVKSLRAGNANLKDSYARIINDELFLLKSHISSYKYGGYDNHEPERDRKLLLHKLEIRRLKRQIETKGVTLVALRIYFVDGKVKVELGIAKGKRKYDKRAAIAERDAKMEIERIKKVKY